MADLPLQKSWSLGSLSLEATHLPPTRCRLNQTRPRPTKYLEEIEYFVNNLINPIVYNQATKALVVLLTQPSQMKPMSIEGSPPMSQVILYSIDIP